jgi:hypothetical protein
VELPRLETLWQKYRDKGLSVVAVEAFRDREGALELINQENLTYHLLENLEGEGEVVAATFRVFGFPSTFVIDGEGKVMFFHFGFAKGDEVKIEKEILKLIGE